MGSPGVHGDRFGAAADDYARHRADFPAAGIDRMVALGVGTPGQRLLDLGCGTGTLVGKIDHHVGLKAAGGHL